MLLSAAWMGLFLGAAEARPPVRQKDLDSWWSASKQMWIGEDAYEAGGTHFTDGVCTADLDEGIIIPVYTGLPPLSERVIGVLFVGKGRLKVDFPHRGDAWSFSNHMVNTGEKTADEMRSIAREGASYEVGITRAMILSADPQVEQVLLEKMPVGSGVFRTLTNSGFNEEYVVTESRGKVRAKMISTNMLAQRTHQLEAAGLDPISILRQDRMLHEEFSFPGEHLRAIADFRTDDRFHVAAIDGAGVGPAGYDEWLTCFRDGLGQSDIGGRSIVFAHGTDQDGRRHLQRMSGSDFPRTPDQTVGRPAVSMEPVHADTTIEIRPVNRRNYMSVTADTLLTVRAQGTTLQHVALSLPTERAVQDSYELLSVETEGGKPLAYVGLHSDDAFFASGKGDASAEAESTSVDEGADPQDVTQMALPTMDPQSAGIGGGGGNEDTVGGTAEGDSTGGRAGGTDALGVPLEMTTVEQETPEYMLVKETPFRYEILVLLPKPIAPGETAKLRIKWRTKWRYSNMTWSGRQMGVTTGVRQFLPELLPAPGGTAWDTTTRFGIPPQGLFPMGGAVSGDTVEEWRAEDGWRWVKTESTGSRKASIGVGKWVDYEEPAFEGMPAVRVHLLTTDAWGIQQFPPEVRRVVSFLQRFMPDLEPTEIELIQGPAMLKMEAVRMDFRNGRSGLIELRHLKRTKLGDSSDIEAKYKHLGQAQIARQVAHQYWGQRTRPNTASDRWVVEALSDAFSAFYIRAGLGAETYEHRIQGVRERIENPTERVESRDLVNRRHRPLSLTTPEKLSDVGRVVRDDYGFFIVAHSLRKRIGDLPFFLAVDRLSQRRKDSWVTTEDLQALFEETSGEDLSDFFDFWVRSGHVPEVVIEVATEETEDGTLVRGCITTDQPFGSFDLPVRITDQDGEREVEARVDVDDGQGAFTVSGRVGKITVLADPDGLLVLRKRKVKRVDSVSCTAPELVAN